MVGRVGGAHKVYVSVLPWLPYSEVRSIVHSQHPHLHSVSRTSHLSLDILPNGPPTSIPILLTRTSTDLLIPTLLAEGPL